MWDQFAGRTVLPTFLGRVAIWQLCEIWQLKPGDEVLMPAYNCGTEVDPFIVHGCKVKFYRVDNHARIDVGDIIRRATTRTKVVYVIHYFGWPQHLRELMSCCRNRGIKLVEDCALALFSTGQDGPLGTLGDAAVFSLSKSLPVPGGGLLVLPEASVARLPVLTRAPVRRCFQKVLTLVKRDLQRKAAFLGLYRAVHSLKARLVRKPPSAKALEEMPDMPSDYYFDRRLRDASIAHVSLGLARAHDPSAVVQRRRMNYLELEHALTSVPGIVPLFDNLPAGVCPLTFPVIVNDPFRWAAFLEGRGIDVYSWWAGFHCGCSWDEFPEARFLKKHLLCLPVDQVLGTRHLAFIAETVRVFGNSLVGIKSPGL